MAGALDLEEINRVRGSLGLPLLPTGSNSQSSGKSNANLNFKPSDNADPEDDPGSTLESRQGEAGSNWDKWHADKLEKKRRETQREQIRKERERAQRNMKLEGKGLADDDDDDNDAKAWLMGSNKRQKKIAKGRDKMLQRELAERERANQAYTEKDLAGLKVGHEYGDFDNNEAGDQILTLADADINDSENEDTLENIDIRDQERVKKRQDLKLRKPAYDPHAIDENGEKSILGQYDEEIDGKKKTQKRFTLDEMGAANSNNIKTDDGSRQRFSLDFDQDNTPISDYQEVKEVKIKKPKKSKKEKSKKKRPAEDDDDLLPETQPESGETMQVDGGNVTSSNGNKRSYEDTFGDDDLQANLAAQRRATLKKQKRSKVEDFVRNIREEGSATPMETNDDEEEGEGAFVLDETSEFVNNMGKERSESPEPLRGRRLKEESPNIKMEDHGSPVDEDMVDRNGYRDTPDNDIKRETSNTPVPENNLQHLTSTGLDAEDQIDRGMGSTLKMLTQRGLYHREKDNANARDRERNRFLREKLMREKRAEDAARAQRERDRQSTQYKQMSNREREAAAQQANAARDQRDSRLMAEAFNREYKPNVDIKYIDEFGRRMDQKEAFKHLSHQFHGKGSGKGKTEKRLQKITQEHSREGKHSLQSDADGFEGAISKQRGTAGVRLQ